MFICYVHMLCSHVMFTCVCCDRQRTANEAPAKTPEKQNTKGAKSTKPKTKKAQEYGHWRNRRGPSPRSSPVKPRSRASKTPKKAQDTTAPAKTPEKQNTRDKKKSPKAKPPKKTPKKTLKKTPKKRRKRKDLDKVSNSSTDGGYEDDAVFTAESVLGSFTMRKGNPYMFTCCVHMLCSHVVFTCYVHMLCSHVMFTCV